MNFKLRRNSRLLLHIPQKEVFMKWYTQVNKHNAIYPNKTISIMTIQTGRYI